MVRATRNRKINPTTGGGGCFVERRNSIKINQLEPPDIEAPNPAPASACYGYARVSTLRQSDEGESLDVQQRVIAGYAQMHGLSVEKVFVERGASGSRPLAERPEGAALLAALRPGDTVITPKLDRMFRSALDALAVLGKLKAKGVSLHMIDLGGDTTGNGVSKLVFTILSAVAEAERDRTRERIAEVKADQRRRGRFLGGSVPFGWRREGDELVQVPEEQVAIGKMRKMRANGLSLRAIRDRLAEAGVKVSHVAIANVLKAGG
jgi:putative DNA-invertase from lambdoid prophage Rac